MATRSNGIGIVDCKKKRCDILASSVALLRKRVWANLQQRRQKLQTSRQFREETVWSSAAKNLKTEVDISKDSVENL